jgi:hypothetical protein
MKEKKGEMMLGFAIKLGIAIACIVLLIIFANYIFGSIQRQNKLKQAEHTLDALIDRINLLEKEGDTIEYLVLNPKNWFLVSFSVGEEMPARCQGWNCLCICEDDKCEKASVCKNPKIESIVENPVFISGEISNQIFLFSLIEITLSRENSIVRMSSIKTTENKDSMINEILLLKYKDEKTIKKYLSEKSNNCGKKGFFLDSNEGHTISRLIESYLEDKKVLNLYSYFSIEIYYPDVSNGKIIFQKNFGKDTHSLGNIIEGDFICESKKMPMIIIGE